MRICHVIEAAGGGSGQVVIELIREGLKRGDDITLVYAPERADWRFLADVEEFSDRITVRTVKMRRSVGPWDAVSLVRLYRVLRRTGPFDVIHGHSSKAGALSRLAGVLLHQGAQVYTPHGFMTLDPGAPRWYGSVERLLAKLCDAVLVGSHYELRHALDVLHLDPKRVHLVRNGIRMDQIADREVARANIAAMPDEFVIGFIGRLVSIKNPQRLASTFAALAHEYPNATLAIVGEGPEQSPLSQELALAGVAERVRFLGGVRGVDVTAGFDVLLCTSDSESFGLMFLEAMAAGVPVVTTPVGISEDVVVAGVTGYRSTFQPQDLAEALGRILALSPAERAAMGEAARQRAQDYGIDQMLAATAAAYDAIVSRRRAITARRGSGSAQPSGFTAS